MKAIWDEYKGAIIVVFVLAVFVTWGSCAKASELYIDIGSSQVGSETTDAVHLQLVNRFDKQHIDLGFGYIGPQTFKPCDRDSCEWKIKEQLYAGVEFIVKDPWAGRARIGFGPYIFQNADRVVTSKFRAGISFEFAFTERIGFKLRHFSAAGTNSDIEACNTLGQCFINDWNSGQDSWARLIWYF
jgi:hypothetical protein